MNLSKHFLRTTALLPLLAATTATTAFAASEQYTTGSASVSNIRVTLIDLDLNDGITPYLSYRENAAVPFDPESWTYVRHEAGLVTHTAENYSQSAFGAIPVNKVLSAPADLMAGTASGHASFAGSSLDTLALSAQSTIDGTYGHGRGVSVGAAFAPRDFYLSPNTALSITVDLSVESVMQGGIAGNYTQSRAIFELSSGADLRYGEARHTEYGNDFYPTQGAAGTKTFTAALTSGAAERLVHIEAVSYVWTSITPVPEPQTWAMLLGGLGLIGAMARRKSAQ